jgi:hypothetical protein
MNIGNFASRKFSEFGAEEAARACNKRLPWETKTPSYLGQHNLREMLHQRPNHMGDLEHSKVHNSLVSFYDQLVVGTYLDSCSLARRKTAYCHCQIYFYGLREQRSEAWTHQKSELVGNQISDNIELLRNKRKPD